jgi:hypothetical protein
MPELDGRELPESVMDVALAGFEEDPGCRSMAIVAHEVDAATHSPEFDLRLRLHEDIPSLGASLQLTHLLGLLVPWKRGAHWTVIRGPGGEAKGV